MPGQHLRRTQRVFSIGLMLAVRSKTRKTYKRSRVENQHLTLHFVVHNRFKMSD